MATSDKPSHFIDNSGDTVRVYPRSAPTAYVRLAYMTAPTYNDTGHMLTPGQYFEAWLRPEAAQHLVDAITTELNTHLFESKDKS